VSSTVWCYSAVRQLQATAVQSDSSGLPSPLCRHAPIDPLAVPVHIYPTCTYHHRTCDHTPCDHHTPVSARLASPDFCFWKLVPQPSPPPVTPSMHRTPTNEKGVSKNNLDSNRRWGSLLSGVAARADWHDYDRYPEVGGAYQFTCKQLRLLCHVEEPRMSLTSSLVLATTGLKLGSALPQLFPDGFPPRNVDLSRLMLGSGPARGPRSVRTKAGERRVDVPDVVDDARQSDPRCVVLLQNSATLMHEQALRVGRLRVLSG